MFTRIVRSTGSTSDALLHCQCKSQTNSHVELPLCDTEMIYQLKRLRTAEYDNDISKRVGTVSTLSGIQPYSSDIADVYDFKVVSLSARVPSFPTESGITLARARTHCRNVLSSSIVARGCHVDVDRIVPMCVDDVRWSDSLEQPRLLIPVLMQMCEASVFSNVSLWSQSFTPTTSLSSIFQPPTFVHSSLCLSDCSGHGRCVASQCVCDAGYIGSDCSFSSRVAPRVFGFANNGVCDLNVDSCPAVNVLGDGFIDSERLMCMFYDGPADRQAERTVGVFESRHEVICELRSPDKMKTIDAIDIRVTTDGRRASNRITYVRYDSRCVNCSRPGECAIKARHATHINKCLCDIDAMILILCSQEDV